MYRLLKQGLVLRAPVGSALFTPHKPWQKAFKNKMFFSLGYLELANAVVMNEFLLHIFVSVFYSKNIPVSSAFVVASYADSF